MPVLFDGSTLMSGGSFSASCPGYGGSGSFGKLQISSEFGGSFG